MTANNELSDEFIYSIIEQMAIVLQVPLILLVKNTKYENYGKI